MAGGRIDCYLDVASIFSYVALKHLLDNLGKLAAHGVQVDFHPVFLGAIMQQTGNRPPWMQAAKAAYLAHDVRRATRDAAITGWATPPDLLALAHTVSPLRALLAVKAAFAPAAFHAALLGLMRSFWTPPHALLADDAVLAAALAAVEDPDAPPRRLFDDAAVRRIMDARPAMKPVLARETAVAVERGAFGAPWLWVTDARGCAEPFFGSDRFAQIYSHLGVAHHGVEVLMPAAKL